MQHLVHGSGKERKRRYSWRICCLIVQQVLVGGKLGNSVAPVINPLCDHCIRI